MEPVACTSMMWQQHLHIFQPHGTWHYTSTSKNSNVVFSIYSASYGVWSSQVPQLGHHVKMSIKEFMEQFLLDFHTCDIVIAKDFEHNHIIRAIHFKYLYKENQEVLWTKQLVVHKDHRNKGVATCKIWKLWTKSNAWPCHPYVVNVHKNLSVQHVDKLIQRNCLPCIQNDKIAFSLEKMCYVKIFLYRAHHGW